MHVFHLKYGMENIMTNIACIGHCYISNHSLYIFLLLSQCQFTSAENDSFSRSSSPLLYCVALYLYTHSCINYIYNYSNNITYTYLSYFYCKSGQYTHCICTDIVIVLYNYYISYSYLYMYTL